MVPGPNEMSRAANIKSLKRSLANASETTLKDKLQRTIENLIGRYRNDKPTEQDNTELKRKKYRG